MASVCHPDERPGTFSSCSTRYNGERDPSKVEEFISAVSTFKAVESVTDINAINGMPMLLQGDAAEWWRGVKHNAHTLGDVVRMIRDAFLPLKTACRIFAEISQSKQQMTEPTDTFICKKRALFSRLDQQPNEELQMDIVFGLLHAQNFRTSTSP